MLSTETIIILGWIFVIAVATYLIALVSLVGKLKRTQKEYWAHISSPKLSDPNGQVVIFLKVICGRDFPASIASAYKTELTTVRVALILSMTAFLIYIVAILNARYQLI